MANELDNRQRTARDNAAPAAANESYSEAYDTASSTADQDIPLQNLSPLEMYARLQRQPASNDPTQIRNFAQMIGGRGTTAAVSGSQGTMAEQQAKEQQRLREEDRHEAARLAEWNETKQMFGGRMMSNADILQAMHDYNKDIDAHAEEAVKQGKIREEEKDEYKRTALRLEELKKLEEQNKLTKEQRREQGQLQQSHAGQVYEAEAAANDNKRDRQKNASLAAMERTGMSYSKEITPSIEPSLLKTDFKKASDSKTDFEPENLPKLDKKADLSMATKQQIMAAFN